MSASESSGDVLGLSLLASDVPRDYARLAEIIVAFYRAIGRPAQWISPWRRDVLARRRKFREQTLRETLLDEQMLGVTVGISDEITEHQVKCFLRPVDPSNEAFETRWVSLTATGLAFETPAVRALLAALIDVYPIAQGGVARYRSLAYAAQECSFSGAVSLFELDDATRTRLSRDQMLSGRFLRRLRRLYPVTIIGPTLWADLPPLPVGAKVEAVGDCKLLHAWPELVEPRDPEFLAGTTELRRWLWPFTIQNQADTPDDIGDSPRGDV